MKLFTLRLKIELHLNRRFDDVTTRLDRIERKLDNHEERIVRVEERTSILHR